MKLTIDSLNQSYELDKFGERARLRNDLEFTGFFLIDGNKKFYDWLLNEQVSKKQLTDFMSALLLFEAAKKKHTRERTN